MKVTIFFLFFFCIKNASFFVLDVTKKKRISDVHEYFFLRIFPNSDDSNERIFFFTTFSLKIMKLFGQEFLGALKCCIVFVCFFALSM